MTIALLSSTYFGPIQWYQKLNRYDRCMIEQHDNFIKQTYRNRCVIPTTNGLQSLSIPVTTVADSPISKTPMKDIRISDHGNWRHIHWNALTSAYGESPFFEYYQDDIRPFFERKWEFLIDFNMEITQKMNELLDIRPTISLTNEFVSSVNDVVDFRDVIRPKHPGNDADFNPIRYYQVYQQKFDFQPNMSILDLLFNEGNESVFYL
ncbi:WbqC family protein [Segatella paludivivens]|uniref:WbqC family protein n=1 Tax=Segatella paludivivens TaxID=185294 RepID=UPI000376AB83|nr:WbqC family protein [Segatella paludivivens]